MKRNGRPAPRSRAAYQQKEKLDLSFLYQEAARYFRVFLAGRQDEARRLRRRLVRRLARAMSAGEVTAKHWLLLADLYTRLKPAECCLRQALRIAPRDAEVHAELAYVLARRGRAREARRHVSLALRYCKAGDPVEEEILYAAGDAAAMVDQEDLARKAKRRGRSRFPDSPLFR